METIVASVDGIVHLGGYSVEGPWEAILSANIVGCYNLFEAARRLPGVERVVFASSNHAVGFYERNRRIGTHAPVRPDSRYGVSKAFGEALGALYAFKHGMRVTCIHIGNFRRRAGRPPPALDLDQPEDLVQLIRIGLERPDIRHEIFFGASDNARGWWDNEAAFRYGYRPHGRSEDHAAAALAAQQKLAADPISDWYEVARSAATSTTAIRSRGRGKDAARVLRRRARIATVAEFDQQRRRAGGSPGLRQAPPRAQLGVGDRRKSVRRRKPAMLGKDRDLGQDAHPEAGRDGGLDAGQVGAGVGDVPRVPPPRRRGSCGCDKGSLARTRRAATGRDRNRSGADGW